MNKKSSIILALLSSTAILSAGESSHYISVMAGSLDFDRTVYGDTDGNENRYQAYSSASITGLNYTWVKAVSENNILIGVSPQLLLTDGSFFDGGFFNVNFLAGKSFGKFKLYGNLGYGLNSLSDYTASTGENYGLTARYDIAKHFSAAVSYNIYNMDIGTVERNNPTSSYSAKGLIGSLSFKF